MKKLFSVFLILAFVSVPRFMAADNYQGNFSVQKWYTYTFNFTNPTSIWGSMKNYDADGYYGDAQVELAYLKDGSRVRLCSNVDTHLAVNETVRCDGNPLSGSHTYYTRGYYHSINGHTSTSDQVYTILS